MLLTSFQRFIVEMHQIAIPTPPYLMMCVRVCACVLEGEGHLNLKCCLEVIYAKFKGWDLCFPTMEAWVPISRNCRFPRVGMSAPLPWSRGFPAQELEVWTGWAFCMRFNIDLCNSVLVFCLMGREQN